MNKIIRIATLNVVKPALAIAIASALGEASRAAAISIDNCTAAGFVPPCYTIALIVPGFNNELSDREPFAVSGNLTGIDNRGIGDGDAFAVAGFGRVGAKSQATYFGALPSPESGVGSSAEAAFNDVFVWGGGPGKLRATLTLTGQASAAGGVPSAPNFASIVGDLGLRSNVDSGFGSLTGPGSITVTINVSPRDNISLDLRARWQLLHLVTP
jgi:hypothetical protein